MSDSPSNPQDVLDTVQGPDGETLTLHAVPGGFEIHADGQLYISSALRRSERELANVGMVALRDRNDITVLIAGLGMGHLLAAVLENPRVVRVDVVEHSSAIINWNRSHFAALHRTAPLDDPRVHVHQMGLSAYLRAFRYKALPTVQLEDSGYLAILLDLDEGPSHLLREKNAELYSEDGLTDLEETLRPGGVLALWSQGREVALIEQLKGRFQNIAEIVIPVEVPASPGLDYLYRARRRPPVHRTRAQA